MRVNQGQPILTKGTTLEFSIWTSFRRAAQRCPAMIPATWFFTLFALYNLVSNIFVILSLDHSGGKLAPAIAR